MLHSFISLRPPTSIFASYPPRGVGGTYEFRFCFKRRAPTFLVTVYHWIFEKFQNTIFVRSFRKWRQKFGRIKIQKLHFGSSQSVAFKASLYTINFPSWDTPLDPVQRHERFLSASAWKFSFFFDFLFWKFLKNTLLGPIVGNDVPIFKGGL